MAEVPANLLLPARSHGDVLMSQESFDSILIFDCSLSRTTAFKAKVTKHAVEEGSPIADHIKPEPIVVTIRGLVSRTPLLPLGETPRPDRELDAYRAIMDAAESAQPVQLVTWDDVRDNMALAEVNRIEDDGLQHLRLKVVLEQIRIAKAQTVEVPEDVIDTLSGAASERDLDNQGADEASEEEEETITDKLRKGSILSMIRGSS